MRLPVELAHAYRLLNHGPTTLISAAHGGVQNVMAAAWVMPLDFEPPKVLAVIDKQSFTRSLIDASGEFALSLPSRELAAATVNAGSSSGRDGDKFASSGLQPFKAQEIAAPLIDGCLAWLECRVIAEPANQQRYDLFIAEVVAAWADSSVFADGHWLMAPDTRHTIHYVAGGRFFETGAAFDV
ncbi:flavin reductase family protein [Paludibacterium yongneupense]|uniref:flavin reductase family protein n=1 Tax=Paludibacterium yongneupense TaxID=400061 RepID=UPI000403FE42|nr:flavin reductase family protein [Paludibacterium yongneupense]